MAKPSDNPASKKETVEPEKPLRVFGNKPFMRFARKFGATNDELWEMCNGDPEADLGGDVCKFRLARDGEGKRGGARSIVALKKADRAVMMFGFEKKDMANINSKELRVFKKLAKQYLDRTVQEMETLVKIEELEEIKHPNDSKPEDTIKKQKK